MRRSLPCAVRSAAMLALLVFGVAGWAGAGALNPEDFPLSGEFPTEPGTYNFSGLAIIGPGNTSMQGTLSANDVRVFDFNSITLGSGQTFVSDPGGAPVALLSRSDLTVNGTIDLSAPGGFDFHGGPGGFGGGALPGAGGFGPGGGGAGGFALVQVPTNPPYGPTTNYSLFGGGGGGGFGGPGNAGGSVSVAGVSASGGSGGRAYADLLGQLQGGSGGAVGLNVPGGGGGGAIELGAVGNISINGSILANGGSSGSFFAGGGGGGGAGGGILLHGEGVTLSGLLSAVGGNGGPEGGDGRNYPFSVAMWGAGGNGGSGQVLLDPGPNGFTNTGGTIEIGNGTFSVVPEPASLVLLGLGLIGVLAYARCAGPLKDVQAVRLAQGRN